MLSLFHPSPSLAFCASIPPSLLPSFFVRLSLCLLAFFIVRNEAGSPCPWARATPVLSWPSFLASSLSPQSCPSSSLTLSLSLSRSLSLSLCHTRPTTLQPPKRRDHVQCGHYWRTLFNTFSLGVLTESILFKSVSRALRAEGALLRTSTSHFLGALLLCGCVRPPPPLIKVSATFKAPLNLNFLSL